jgi:hypothetical protein
MSSRRPLLVVALCAAACAVDDSNLVVPEGGTGGIGGDFGASTGSTTGSMGGLGGTEGGKGGSPSTSSTGGAVTGGMGGLVAGGSGGSTKTGGTPGKTGGSGGTTATGGGGGTAATGGAGGTAATGGSGGTSNGGSGGVGGSGGTANSGGTSGTDGIRFHFETDIQEWRDLTQSRCQTCAVVDPTRTESMFFSGGAALAYRVQNGGPSRERVVGVTGQSIGPLVPGAVITFHVFVPEGHNFASMEAFVQTVRMGSWVSDRRVAGQLLAGKWNPFVITVPEAFKDERPLELGVLFLLANGESRTTVFIDHVAFVPGP